MSPQIRILMVFVPALIVGGIFAMLVNPPADGDFATKFAYYAIGFLIGFVPVAVLANWLLKKFGPG